MLVSLLTLAVSTAARVPLEPDVPLHDPATSSWEYRGPPAKDALVDLNIQLHIAQAGRDALEAAFWAVSDPDSTSYGRHLNIEKIRDLLAVPADRVERVRDFFREYGAVEIEVGPFNDVLHVRMAAWDVERALETKLGAFVHSSRPEMGGTLIRARARGSLPDHLAADVDIVGELHQFPRLRFQSAARSTVEERAAAHVESPPSLEGGAWPNACSVRACQGRVTPAVLAQRYRLPNASHAADARSSMAVAEFQGQHFREQDLAAFSAACHANASVAAVVGRNVSTGGVEAELDIEYIKGVAPAVPLTVVYVQKFSLLKWAHKITGMAEPPHVHSVSYGNDEAQQSGQAYMTSVNTALMKAGARGLTILFASGDSGVCGREECGYGPFGPKRFHPDFPATSPYQTAVGGTDFVTRDIGDETAWSRTGGGFSDVFSVPRYQAAAVAAFMNTSRARGLLPPQKLWNAGGRGFPDVAALAGGKAPYCVATSGAFGGTTFEGISGTSAATPVIGGMIALLNARRLANGKPPLGFVNPLFYSHPEAFHDVTSGCNKGLFWHGFTAIPGWDAASGLGTPNFEALAALV